VHYNARFRAHYNCTERYLHRHVAVGVVCTEMIDVECASDCVSDEDSGCDDGHLS